MDVFEIVRIFVFTSLSFVVAIIWTPLLTHFLFKYKLGKKIRDAKEAPIMAEMHAHKSGTPTMGGILVWGTVLLIALVFFYLAWLTDIPLFDHLNFLSRSQTYLPLGMFVAASLVGLFDDVLNVKGIGPKGGGLQLKHKLAMYAVIALVGAFWFYFKLDWDLIRVPFLGNFQIGWWYIPVFIFIIVGTSFSVNQTDGLDGLAGGTLASAFAIYGGIAFAQGRYDLATFCGVIAGALLAFLWFNIPPARFFMGDTGSMGLGVTLGIVALLTNTVLLLPLIGFVFVLEAVSTIVQLLSKKFLSRKVFISAPIHHHLEALGWSESKIVMRFWIVAAVMGTIGLILALLDRLYI